MSHNIIKFGKSPIAFAFEACYNNYVNLYIYNQGTIVSEDVYVTE